tara:strand:- start:2161 stop:2799 length:639 start_codon:yes stop_codon:yes gene_type:complete
MKNIITAICAYFDKELNTNITAKLNGDFDFNRDVDISDLTEEMLNKWPVKTELIQSLYSESGADASQYNDEQIKFARCFVFVSDECNATHKEVREFTRSLRSKEILKHLDTVNYWLATRRVFELADFGDVEKYRLEETIIKEPFNFQIQTSAKVSMTKANCEMSYGSINLHYTHGQLHIRFISDTGITLRNTPEIIDALIQEFGICHFSTKF